MKAGQHIDRAGLRIGELAAQVAGVRQVRQRTVHARGDLLDIERRHHIRRRLVDDARAQPVLVAQNRQRRHLHVMHDAQL